MSSPPQFCVCFVDLFFRIERILYSCEVASGRFYGVKYVGYPLGSVCWVCESSVPESILQRDRWEEISLPDGVCVVAHGCEGIPCVRVTRILKREVVARVVDGVEVPHYEVELVEPDDCCVVVPLFLRADCYVSAEVCALVRKLYPDDYELLLQETNLTDDRRLRRRRLRRRRGGDVVVVPLTGKKRQRSLSPPPKKKKKTTIREEEEEQQQQPPKQRRRRQSDTPPFLTKRGKKKHGPQGGILTRHGTIFNKYNLGFKERPVVFHRARRTKPNELVFHVSQQQEQDSDDDDSVHDVRVARLCSVVADAPNQSATALRYALLRGTNWGASRFDPEVVNPKRKKEWRQIDEALQDAAKAAANPKDRNIDFAALSCIDD